MDSVNKAKGKKFYAGLAAAVLIIAVFAVYLGTGITGNTVAQTSATQNIKDIYGLLTDKDVEIVGMQEQSGIYRVFVRTFDNAGNPSIQEIFITKDSKLITDKLFDVEDYKTRLQNNKDFINCLYDKGVLVLGLSSENYTMMQMSELGDFAYRIYFDCGGDNIQVCQQFNITTVPAIIYNQTAYEGLRSADWFEKTTGCTIKK